MIVETELRPVVSKICNEFRTDAYVTRQWAYNCKPNFGSRINRPLTVGNSTKGEVLWALERISIISLVSRAALLRLVYCARG